MTLSKTTFSIMTLRILILSRMGFSAGTFHRSIECHYDECHCVECHYVERRFAESHYAECRDAQGLLAIWWIVIWLIVTASFLLPVKIDGLM